MFTKEQLLSKRNELVANIKLMEQTQFVYVIPRPFQQFGDISEMDKDNLVMAFAKLKSLHVDLTKAAEELKLSYNVSNTLMGGYSYEEWKTDMLTRSAELKLEESYHKASAALEIIESHLSEDDKFALAMEQVDKLLS